MEFKSIVGYPLEEEQWATLLRVTFDEDTTADDVVIWLADHTQFRAEHPGVEGCPGSWFISHVQCVYLNPIYKYALVEVHWTWDV